MCMCDDLSVGGKVVLMSGLPIMDRRGKQVKFVFYIFFGLVWLRSGEDEMWRNVEVSHGHFLICDGNSVQIIIRYFVLCWET